jgi:WD40 repeat protein
VASGSSDKTVRLWDSTTGAPRGTLEGHSRSVNTVAFSPDGKLVASGSGDKTVKLWDLTTGASRDTLEGHSDSVCIVIFSPDGKLVASGSHDNTVRLWDSVTGASLQMLNIDTTISGLSFSKDGRYLETDRGSLNVQSTLKGNTSFQPQSPCNIFVKSYWVTRGTENLLWLPSDYRTTCTAVQNNVLVLGHASGHVTFIGFSLS